MLAMISKTYRKPLPLHFGPAISRYHDVDQEPVVKRRRLLPDRFPCNAEPTMEAAVTAPSLPDPPVAGLPQPRRQQAVGVAIDSAGSDWATRNKTFVADTPVTQRTRQGMSRLNWEMFGNSRLDSRSNAEAFSAHPLLPPKYNNKNCCRLWAF
jgi:hypothetical protein